MFEQQGLEFELVRNGEAGQVASGARGLGGRVLELAKPPAGQRIDFLHQGALAYMREFGLAAPAVPIEIITSSTLLSRRIGTAFINAPEVEKGAHEEYAAFAVEVQRQFDYLTRPQSQGGLGVRVQVCQEDPYKNLEQLTDDLRNRRLLRVWGTGECGNPHPVLTNEQNNMFRAVHDAFGHAASGAGFDRRGEEAAWYVHAHMFSPGGRMAMTVETRGINNVVFGFERDKFPDQKACILPAEFADPRSVVLADA